MYSAVDGSGLFGIGLEMGDFIENFYLFCIF
jgi:hypothetical protein